MTIRSNRTWLIIALVSSIVLLSAHLYALAHYTYWYLPWFDVPMHIFGGAALGSCILAFGTTRRTSTYLLCMVAVVLGWEVFEYIGSISTGQANYWHDTATDMINGVAGSLVPLLIARITSWR